MPRRAGRPPSGIIRLKLELHLPHDLVMWLNARFHDPRTGKARYGERTKLIERLLREYKTQQENHPEESNA